ncbi:hypothetical protein EVC12_191 [Rhizobium phage RHph_I42]|nr:hypothetical protein EVC12_191 [Rhizobium phage RHph_I42]
MIRFTIERHDDCWSFATEEHGLHMGYPDALQAVAAAMRAFDPTLPRLDIDADDLRHAVAVEKRAHLHVVD